MFGQSQLDLNPWLGGRATSTEQVETRSSRMGGREAKISSCGKVTLKMRGVTGGQCRNEDFNSSKRNSRNQGKCPKNCSAAAAGQIFPDGHEGSVMEIIKAGFTPRAEQAALGKLPMSWQPCFCMI